MKELIAKFFKNFVEGIPWLTIGIYAAIMEAKLGKLFLSSYWKKKLKDLDESLEEY